MSSARASGRRKCAARESGPSLTQIKARTTTTSTLHTRLDDAHCPQTSCRGTRDDEPRQPHGRRSRKRPPRPSLTTPSRAVRNARRLAARGTALAASRSGNLSLCLQLSLGVLCRSRPGAAGRDRPPGSLGGGQEALSQDRTVLDRAARRLIGIDAVGVACRDDASHFGYMDEKNFFAFICGGLS